jgi:hypothetical protein
VCVQRRRASSAGDSPARVRARGPVAWVADWRETEGLKPIDKANFGLVSESPGRNESEPRGGLENSDGTGGRARTERVKAAWIAAGWLGRRFHSGGVIGAAR